MIRIGPFVLAQVAQGGIESKPVAASPQEQGQTPPSGSEFGKVFTRHLKKIEKRPLEPREEVTKEAVLDEQKGQALPPNWFSLTFVSVLPVGEITVPLEDAASSPLKTDAVTFGSDTKEVALATLPEEITREEGPLREEFTRQGADLPEEEVRPTSGKEQEIALHYSPKTVPLKNEGDSQARGVSSISLLDPDTADFSDELKFPQTLPTSVAKPEARQVPPPSFRQPEMEPGVQVGGATSHEHEQIRQTEGQKSFVPKDVPTQFEAESEAGWPQIMLKDPVLRETVPQGLVPEDSLEEASAPPQFGAPEKVVDTAPREIPVQVGEIAEPKGLPRTDVKPEVAKPSVPAESSPVEARPERVVKPQAKKGSMENIVIPRPIHARGEAVAPVSLKTYESLVENADAKPQIRAVLDFQDKEQLIPKLVQKMESLVQDERTEVRIQLKPDHLGELKIKLSLERGIMVAEFVVHNETVREVIASQLPQLQTALQNQGSNMADVSVNVGLGHKGADERGKPGSKQPGQDGNGRLQRAVASRPEQAYLGRSIWNQVDVRV